VQKDGVLEEPSLVFMFPGQGSQYVEMGKGLCEHFPEFQKNFSEVCALLDREMGIDFKSFIFDPKNKETLENTKYTQPALFAIEVSMGRMLLGWGIVPKAMIGHSVGEFAAAHLAGVFSLEDGVKMIVARGRLMASLPTGKMLSVRGPIADVLKAAGKAVDVASMNSPIHCVLAGEDAQIKQVQEQLEKQGFACRLLHTSHAFHSSMMDPVVEPFLEITKTVRFSAPRLKIISTVVGEQMTDANAMDPAYWANHLRSTVRFSPALTKSISEGGNLFLEVGPRTTLSSLAIQHLKDVKGGACSTLNDDPSPAAEVGSLGAALAKLWVHGLELPWARIWDGGNRIPLVQYPYERKEFRFSDGRTRQIATVSQEIFASEESAGAIVETQPMATGPVNVEEVLVSDLGRLFSEYAGLRFEAVDATFVENGFDSLVLMQIGVELGKKYGISVSLRDLMESRNSLKRLAAHIAKTATADRLPQATPAKSIPARTVPAPALPTKIQPLPADAAQIIHQQLSHMKEVLELQLKFVASVSEKPLTVTPPPAAPAQKPREKLIRAKHQAPPSPEAFRGKTANGTDAWLRFDPETQTYQVLN
jgi:malonyl CoA-acyl carrier protein transacylase